MDDNNNDDFISSYRLGVCSFIRSDRLDRIGRVLFTARRIRGPVVRTGTIIGSFGVRTRIKERALSNRMQADVFLWAAQSSHNDVVCETQGYGVEILAELEDRCFFTRTLSLWWQRTNPVFFPQRGKLINFSINLTVRKHN